MSMMRKLLEAMTKFAGEPEQKPGEQWKGTDKGTPGKKLVGDSIIKDLAKGPTPKTKEEELAEAYANFMEDDIGVEPKRPGRKSDRPSREYTKDGKPSKRYTTVEDMNEAGDRAGALNTAIQLKKAIANSQGKPAHEIDLLNRQLKHLMRKYNIKPEELNPAAGGYTPPPGSGQQQQQSQGGSQQQQQQPPPPPPPGGSKSGLFDFDPGSPDWFAKHMDASAKMMQANQADLNKAFQDNMNNGPWNMPKAKMAEGWNTGSDRVSLDDSTSAYWNGQGPLQKEYDALYEKLVPASGAADTMEGEVLRAASKIVYRHFNDGDDFNKASFDQLKPMIGAVTSYDDLAHKATEFALKANGNYHPNQGWDCLDVMDYGPAEEEEYDDEEDDEDDTNWEEEDDELEESSNVVARYADDRARGTGFVYNVDATGQITSSGNFRHNKKYSTPEKAMAYLEKCGFTKKGELEEADMFKAGQRAIKNIKSTEQQRKSEANKMAQAQSQIDVDRENERDRFSQEELYPSDDSHDLDEGAADVYSITSERNGRERSKSGTLAELIEYYGYTLETGKSYEHERGNRKINLNPKNIESLVQNLNNAKSNAAANGQSNERFYVDHGNMAEGRGSSKGLHKKVTIVKGRDAGKTGYVRQIKTDKLRNKVYLDLDLEDGGQSVVLKQDVRLVKEVDEARTTWNNDFYVYDPKTKTVKKKFRTHKGATQYAEANGLKVASAEYYHDTVSKEVEEGWEADLAKSNRERMKKERAAAKPMKPLAKAKPNYDRVFQDINSAIGDTFPDGDPMDALMRKYRDSYGDLNIDLLNKACRVNGAKSYHDYVAKVWQQHMQDNPDLVQGGNPWVAEGLGKDIKRLATGKDVKSRAGQEIAKSQDAIMKGDTKTSKKHFDRFVKLDKLANKEQGVAEGEVSTRKYEMMLRNGQVKKFVAKDDADAKRIAAGHNAKSVIRMKGNVPGNKIAENDHPQHSVDRYNKDLERKIDKDFDPDYDRKMSDQEFEAKLKQRGKERDQSRINLDEEEIPDQSGIYITGQQGEYIDGPFDDLRSVRHEWDLHPEYYKKAHKEELTHEEAWERFGIAEGWESGPEERTTRERDPDAEYDARRQEKLDAPYAQKEPEAKGYHVVSLDTRQPVTDKVFPTKGHAMAYIQSNHSKNLAYRAINEGIESGDPVESAVLAAVQELIQQGHTEVAPEVITNMVVAATSQPFLLKDLVDCNNNSPAIQHYVDSINPTKVKFSNEILTVKNEDPMKDKKQAQAGVSSMAARAASRNRLGETKAISELSTDLVTKVGTARAQQLAPHVASNSTSPDRLKFAIKKNKAVDNLLAKSRAANEKGDTASAQQAVAGVRKIRDTVDGISEGSETPLRDTEDYQAKRSALQQIQMDPDTHKDPQLKAELARRLGSLNQQYSDLQSKLREFKESRGHKVIATKLGNMDRMNNVQIPTPAERQEQIRLRKEKETVKKPVKEFAVPGAATVATATPGAKPAVDPAAVAKAAAATNTLKAATGTTVAPATLDKALDSATQGTATSTDVKALAPIMGVLNKAAADPKLASQFKTIANQAKLTP